MKKSANISPSVTPSELGLLSFIKRSKLTTEAAQNTIQDVAAQTQLLLLQQQQLQNKHQGATG